MFKNNYSISYRGQILAGLHLAVLVLLCSCGNLEMKKYAAVPLEAIPVDVRRIVSGRSQCDPRNWRIISMNGAIPGAQMLQVSCNPDHYLNFAKVHGVWCFLGDVEGLATLSNLLAPLSRHLASDAEYLTAFCNKLTFAYRGPRGVVATDEFALKIDEEWNSTVKVGAMRLQKFCRTIQMFSTPEYTTLKFNYATRVGSVESWTIVIERIKDKVPQITSIKIRRIVKPHSFTWGLVP